MLSSALVVWFVVTFSLLAGLLVLECISAVLDVLRQIPLFTAGGD